MPCGLLLLLIGGFGTERDEASNDRGGSFIAGMHTDHNADWPELTRTLGTVDLPRMLAPD